MKTADKTIVQALLENDIWNFWSADWSKRLIVQWDGTRRSLKPHLRELKKKLGDDFGYERRVSAVVEEQKINLVIS
jgi:hypothetical protein